MLNEKEKYESLYNGYLGLLLQSDKDTFEHQQGGYGRQFWGKGIINFLLFNDAKSVCDVGCGYGVFCNVCTTFMDKVYGLDIASVAAGQVIDNKKILYINSDAAKIPMVDGHVEWVTSFDCLEHIPEYRIEKVLDELRRVSSIGMIISVSDEECFVDGVPLHLTRHPLEWWEDRLRNYGTPQRIGRDPYRGKPYICVRFLSK